MRRAWLVAAIFLLLPVASQVHYAAFDMEVELWPSHGHEGAAYGAHVATDGERVAVGAPEQDQTGAVYVYKRFGTRFVEEAHITPATGIAQSFGASVAIHGTTLVVGAPGYDGGPLTPDSGRVDVYRLQSGSWQKTSTWECGRVALARCGEAVAVTQDHIFIGRPGSAAGTAEGQVTIHRNTAGMTLQATLVDNTPRRFGAALATDGETLLIGAPARSGTHNVAPGNIHFYERDGQSWHFVETKSAPSSLSAPSTFGHQVTVDGIDAAATTLLQTVDGRSQGGEVVFYERRGTGWTEFYVDGTELEAIALQGGTALVGAWIWQEIWVYSKFPGEGWFWTGVLGGWDHFGEEVEGQVSLALAGRLAVLGAPDDSHQGTRTGGAKVYIDNLPPYADAGEDLFADDEDGDGRQAFTLRGRGYDGDGVIVSYTWYEGTTRLGTGANLTLTRPIGTYFFTLEVEDDLGAKGTDVVKVKVRVPRTEAAFSFGPDGAMARDYVWFRDESRDLRSPIRHWQWDFDADGVVDSTAQHPYWFPPKGGEHQVHLTTVNQLGGTLEASAIVHVGPGWPEAEAGRSRVVVDKDPQGVEPVTLDGSGSWIDAPIVSWSWREGIQNHGAEEKVETTLSRGLHDIWLEIEDERGQWGFDTVRYLVLQEGYNETVLQKPDPQAAIESLWGRFYRFEDQTVHDPPIAIWRWDIDGDGETDSEDRRFYERFPEGGLQEVTLTVIAQDGGESTKTFDVQVPDHPPHAWAGIASAAVPVDTYMILHGDGYDDGEDVTFSWRLSDGGRSTHQTLGHVFSRIGPVTVNFTVTDDAGQWSSIEHVIDVLSRADFEAQYGAFDPSSLELENTTLPPAPANRPPELPSPTTPPEPQNAAPDEKPAAEARDLPITDTWHGIPLWWLLVAGLVITGLILGLAPVWMQRK